MAKTPAARTAKTSNKPVTVLPARREISREVVTLDTRAVQRCWTCCAEAALLHTRGEVGV